MSNSYLNLELLRSYYKFSKSAKYSPISSAFLLISASEPAVSYVYKILLEDEVLASPNRKLKNAMIYIQVLTIGFLYLLDYRIPLKPG